MTGSHAPRLKLQALTVSVNYADFLETIAPNRRHFDRWLVVTDENDHRTREVCRRHGMEVLISRRLYENGAVFHKAAALNEGLDALDQDTWTVVLDSDILLPSDFRERLECQSLEPHCLYGISGRRICRTLAEFRHLANSEPWGENLLFSTFVIGYFHLFHMAQPNARYPEGGRADASTYDVYFSQRFPVHHHRYLPFTALHAGAPSVNWQGRKSDPFFPGDQAPADAAPHAAPLIAAATGGPAARAALIGCWRGTLPSILASHFHTVHTIDHWGLCAPGATPIAEADRQHLIARYTQETAGLPQLLPLQEHSGETLDLIPDGSLDLIWFAPEPDYDFLLTALPAWVRKLRPGGALAGSFYDPEAFPGNVSTLHLLLGPPTAHHPGGQWIKHIRQPATFAATRLTFPAPPETGRCIIYLCLHHAEVPALLVSLTLLLNHWSGPVCVLCAGEEAPSLRIACARLGVSYRLIPAAPEGTPPLLARLEALAWAPGEECLLLGPAAIVLRSPDDLFAPLAHAPAAVPSLTPVRPSAAILECFAWKKSAGLPGALTSRGHAFTKAIGPFAAAPLLAQFAHSTEPAHWPPALVSTGASTRVPSSAAVHIAHRLARGSALPLLPAWEAAEAQLLARLAEDI